MGKNFHTVIVVPHARARLRKWRVSNTQITVVLSLLLVLTLAAAFFTWGFFTQTVDSAEIERLRGENSQLRSINTAFEADVRQLQDKLADYEDRTVDLAIVAGLDPAAEGGEAGIGGGDETAGLTGLAERTARLDGALDRVEAKLDEQMRWVSSTPAITPAKGILTSNFGVRRDPITHGRAFHAGLDIARGAGRAGPRHRRRCGHARRPQRRPRQGVYVSHGYGISTRYGHMSKLAVKAGERVHRGDVVGYVGSTGRSTGYHLHYEVHVDGKPVDPTAYLLDQTLQ